jgi:hypothetical protein
MHRILIGLFCGIAFWASASGFAQEIPEQLRERFGASRYYLGKEDALLISVNVLGYVNKPGQYMVPNETDLVSLIAYAGGLRENAKLYNIRVVRSFATNGQPNILTVDLRKYFDTGNRKLIPQMIPEDTIIVPGSKPVTLEKILDYAFKIAVVAQSYFYLREISKF